jgi:hypothetical protein
MKNKYTFNEIIQEKETRFTGEIKYICIDEWRNVFYYLVSTAFTNNGKPAKTKWVDEKNVLRRIK